MIRPIWLAAGCLLTLAVAFPPAAAAQPYGAIAYDQKSGSWGVAYNQGSQDRANVSALGECRKHAKDCGVVVRFWGEVCAAYATDPGKASGWGTGDTRAMAERNAVKACSGQGRDCAAKVWSCNDRGTAGNEAFTPAKMFTYWD